MLRKLIALAITSGLAKKAWDVYRENKRTKAASTTPFKTTARARAGTGNTTSDTSGNPSSPSSHTGFNG